MVDQDAFEQLVAEARRQLAEGATPEQAFARLCLGADAESFIEAGIAVSVAVGVPKVEAHVRLAAGRYLHAFSTGRLHEAFVFVSRPEQGRAQEVGAAYWQRLVEAAELLGPDGDDEYVDAVRRCRGRLEQN